MKSLNSFSEPSVAGYGGILIIGYTLHFLFFKVLFQLLNYSNLLGAVLFTFILIVGVGVSTLFAFSLIKTVRITIFKLLKMEEKIKFDFTNFDLKRYKLPISSS